MEKRVFKCFGSPTEFMASGNLKSHVLAVILRPKKIEIAKFLF